MVNCSGAALIVQVPVAVQPFASVTVNIYVPGPKLLKSSVVDVKLDGPVHEYV